MRIFIIGAGALGCALGARLADAGNDVTLINRNAAHVAAINETGLIVIENGISRSVAIAAATHCSGPAADLVIILVKSMDTGLAVAAAAPVIGDATVLLSLQNGLGQEEVLADAVGAARVIAGKTYAGGVLTAPGQIIAGTAGKDTIIGELGGTVSPRIQAIAAVFEAAGLHTIISANIQGAMWDKLLVNVATGAVSAITGLAYGKLYAVPEIEAVAVAAVAEAMAVAAACDIALETRDPRDAWAKASAGLPADFKASMLQSLEKGARTEVDFINGAVVRHGAAVGVPTPVNATLVACVKGLEAGLRESQP